MLCAVTIQTEDEMLNPNKGIITILGINFDT